MNAVETPRTAFDPIRARRMRSILTVLGILGVLGGIAGGFLLSGVIGFGVTISPGATTLALLVSLAVGVIAGVYPAARAARLAPIDALRTE